MAWRISWSRPFGFVSGGSTSSVFEELPRFREHDAAHGDEIAVEIHRADERFVGIGERARALAAAARFFAAAHHEIFADADAARARTRRPSRETMRARILVSWPSLKLGVMIEKILGEDELEDGVAEEFEPLIVEMMALGFVAEARMRQRLRKEERIAELVFDALFERIHLTISKERNRYPLPEG